MTGGIAPCGLALQVEVGDSAAGREFYAALFGRGPDFSPHDDFHEWQVCAGAEVWWQIVGVPGEPRPLSTRVRFLVTDMAEATRRVRTELGVSPDESGELPGVVAFTDFDDPWGNRIGVYEDLVPSGEQAAPGGSVHDASLFRRR